MVSFFPTALSSELVFELSLAPASNVVKGSDASKLSYELTNIQLEYEVIHSKELVDKVESNYKNGKRGHPHQNNLLLKIRRFYH